MTRAARRVRADAFDPELPSTTRHLCSTAFPELPRRAAISGIFTRRRLSSAWPTLPVRPRVDRVDTLIGIVSRGLPPGLLRGLFRHDAINHTRSRKPEIRAICRHAKACPARARVDTVYSEVSAIGACAASATLTTEA
jgi:hypothetical protein